MKDIKSDYLLSLGLLFVALSIVLRQFIIVDASAITEFISGFFMGLGVCFEFVGILTIRHSKILEKIKNFKNSKKKGKI